MEKTPLKIGSLLLKNNLFLAPMAGITNYPMRLLARDEGTSLCYTEMVSVNGLVRDGKKSFAIMESPEEDRPLGIQLFGDDPVLFAEGARLSESYGNLIDINMGCPVKKVVNSGAGSALLQNPLKIKAIIKAVRSATSLPLTIKIRSGWSSENLNYLEVGKIAEEEGADAVTLHPRTKTQMFEGKADWAHIKLLKERLSIPVIGSGDLFSSGDVTAMLNYTGCDGVMIARGAMGNPWIFSETISLLKGEQPVSPTKHQRLSVALKHISLLTAALGEKVALREMRKHLSWYAKGLSGAARFRERINGIEEMPVVIEVLKEFFT
ncbi:MAG: tRNA dihydrouridine synthase DusB [Desulfuromonadales bacterium]|nr:tRNA dihydrouridine synthase DusB [Desulfuromonadales bacterium]